MEDRLDDVAAGRAAWTDVLADFWAPLAADVAGAASTAVTEIVDAVDASLGASVLGSDRACPACGTGRLGVKLSAAGGFIGCSTYPACGYTRPLHPENAGGSGSEGSGSDGSAPGAVPDQPRLLGADPASGAPITLRRGPYGLYVQLGPVEAAAGAMPAPPAPPPPAAEGDGKKKKAKAGAAKAPPPRRASLPKGADPAAFSLDDALDLLAYPRPLGTHPSGGGPVEVARGPYGFYVRHTPPGFATAAPGRGGRRSGPAGPRPPSAQLPPEKDPQTVTLDVAVQLIADKLAAGGGGGAARRGGKAAEAVTAPAPATLAEAKAKKAKAPAAAPAAPTTPRRPSAYLAFAAAERPAVVAALGPGASTAVAVMREVGARWSALGQEGKAAWAAAHLPALEAGAGAGPAAAPTPAEKAPVKAKQTAKAAPATGKAAKAAPAAGAKRPPSAYLLFCTAARPAAVADLAGPDGSPPKPAAVMAELGARWKGLGEADRARWDAAAAAAAKGDTK